MATDAQSLLAAANCYVCNSSSNYDLMMMKLSLEMQWLLELNPAADVTPEGLLASAACYNCYASSPYMLQLLKLGLLKQLAEGS